VPVLFQEVTRFLPQVASNPGLIPAMRNVIVGSLLIVVLWFRPQGIIPERKWRFYDLPLKRRGPAAPTEKEGANVAAG